MKYIQVGSNVILSNQEKIDECIEGAKKTYNERKNNAIVSVDIPDQNLTVMIGKVFDTAEQLLESVAEYKAKGLEVVYVVQ